eukprot:TRINITY_DN9069_c0_g1_i1.p1 TRINITY_DN9069_c0_g1~~TRINITY_DN9069_c0_g1_i1.p1  ORF type:complete len:275 (+),score=65.92 TRINITY_DN9069_c0_g1_i1:3-827(+)
MSQVVSNTGKHVIFNELKNVLILFARTFGFAICTKISFSVSIKFIQNLIKMIQKRKKTKNNNSTTPTVDKYDTTNNNVTTTTNNHNVRRRRGNENDDITSMKSILKDGYRFGLFIGSMVSIYNFLNNFLLPNYFRRGNNDHYWNPFIAGFIAGGTLIFDVRRRRSDISIYLLGHMISDLSSTLLYYFFNVKLIKGFDILLFVLIGGLMQYTFVWESDAMDHSLYNLLYSMTTDIDKQALDYSRRLTYNKNKSGDVDDGDGDDDDDEEDDDDDRY